MKPIFFVTFFLTLLITGQILWKKGVSLLPNAFNGSLLNTLLQVFCSWYILTGIVVYGVAMLLWLYLLSLYDLSYIYPVTSLSFVLAALVSYFFLGEAVPINRWIGVTVICLGVYLVSIK